MLYTISLLILLVSAVLKRYQLVAVGIASVFLAILNGWPEGFIRDYPSYALAYLNPSNYPFEAGYTAVANIGRSIGMGYEMFRFLYYVIFYAILTWGIYRFTKNVALPFLLYVIAFYAYDAVQVRHAAASFLLVLAFSFLKRRAIQNYAIAIGIVIIAAQFQVMAYAFLPFIFLTLLSYSKIWKAALIIIPLSTLLILFKEPFLEFVGGVLSSLSARENISTSIMNYINPAPEYVVVSSIILMLVTILAFLYFNNTFVDDQYHRVFSTLILFSPIVVVLLGIAWDYNRLMRIFMIFFFIWVQYTVDANLPPRNKLVPLTIRQKQTLVFFGFIVAFLNIQAQSFYSDQFFTLTRTNSWFF